MPSIGEIAVNLVARTSGLESGFKRAKHTIDGFAASASRVAGTLAGMVGVAGGFGGLGFAAKLAADAEQAKVAINTMTGSLEVTKRLLAEINTFSTVTPFEPTELREAAQSLLAFNFSTSEVMGTLNTLGDISAGTGRRLIEFVQIVGKVRDRGKLTAETLNEFGLRAASVMEPLAQVLGVSREEVVKLASAGKISFNDLMKALKMMTSEGGLYFDAMQKQSETLAGRWSTLTGNVKLLGENLGALLLPPFGILVDLGNQFLAFLLSVDPKMVRLVASLAAGAVATYALAKAIPPVVAGYKAISAVLTAMVTKQTFLQALQGPKGWLQIGAALATTVGITATLYSTLGESTKATDNLAVAMGRVSDNTKKAAEGMVKIAKLHGEIGTRQLSGRVTVADLAEATAKAKAAGYTIFDDGPNVSIRSRSILGSPGSGVLDEVKQSNALLTQIEANTREGGVEVREADL